MILQEKLEKPYEEYTIRSKVWIKCDYCGKHFERDKKSREKMNKNVAKDSCGDKPCKSAKRAEVNQVVYGTTSLFKSEKFLKQQEENSLKKYGTKSYFGSDDFREKRKQTLKEKYGVENPLQSPEILAKQQQTCLDNYGVTNYSQAEDFLEKRAATNRERYGADNAMQNPDCVKKRNETCKKKYGKESYSQTEEYWDRRKETCKDKYGVEHPHQLSEIREKARATNRERYGVENYAKTEEFKKRFQETCLERYGVPNPLCLPQNQVYGRTQQEIMDWLNGFGCNFSSDYTILGSQEIDLYDEKLKIGIEYCGLFWHNELSPNPRLRFYHHDKYIKCLEKGVRLITIFEDEWKTRRIQCEGVLRAIINRPEEIIYARKCSIKQIEKQHFKLLCDQYHLQGGNHLGLAFYALEYQGEMVGGLSFGRHHRGKDSLTLDRMFFKPGVRVAGGASRLFKHAVDWAITNQYTSVISWSDNRWSQGDIYEQLGFQLEAELPPDYSYVDAKKPYFRISKQSQKKSNTDCPADKTEYQWSLEKGLARIWDCGKKRWVISIN